MNQVWHPAAEIELLQQVSYYESRLAGLSARFLEEIDQALEHIARSPQRYPILRGSTRRCSLIKFPFAIYFSAQGDSIFIHAISHRRRRPDYWRNRLSETR